MALGRGGEVGVGVELEVGEGEEFSGAVGTGKGTVCTKLLVTH